MLNIEEIASLIKKQVEGSLTEEEAISLEEWAKSNPKYRNFLNSFQNEESLLNDVSIWKSLENTDEEDWERRLERETFDKIARLLPSTKIKSKSVLARLLPYAAILFMFATIGVLFYLGNIRNTDLDVELVQEIPPANNRAELRLENGSVIELDNDKSGIVVGNELIYDDGTKVLVNDIKISSLSALTTPRGGKYQITLPDGTKVWLNAASTLTYPSKFSAKQREVELDGEAYFEVAKAFKIQDDGTETSARLPFIVKTANQSIEVLGTAFNVMAYSDESTTSTTLVEGSVLLKTQQASLKLTPGEQGVSNESSLTKKRVDVNQHIGWKNNKFIFHETELRKAMLDLSRWYDLEIVYEDGIPDTHFYGEISREKRLSDVLKILEMGGVNFRIEKHDATNKLIVFP